MDAANSALLPNYPVTSQEPITNPKNVAGYITTKFQTTDQAVELQFDDKGTFLKWLEMRQAVDELIEDGGYDCHVNVNTTNEFKAVYQLIPI